MKTTQNFSVGWLYQKMLLFPLGLDKENALVLPIIITLAAIMCGSFYYFDGNVHLAVGIVYLCVVLVLSLLSLDLSLYLFMFTVILFEQYEIPSFPALTDSVYFFRNLKEIPYVPYFDEGVIAPFEIHILFLCLGLFIHACIKKDFFFKPLSVWGSFLLFFGFLLFGFFYGLKNGGDFLVALWEVRALFYLCLMYIIVPQILDTKKQISILFWLFIIGVTIKAIQGVLRFIDLGFTTGGYALLTNHEDPVFMVTLFVLLIGFLVFNTGKWQLRSLLMLLLPLGLGFYVAQRRASYASLMVSLSALVVILPALIRIKFLTYFLPVLLVIIIYGAAFWNNTGTLGRPVQMIKSGIEKPDKETNFQDYSSNLYRAFENYDLSQTIIKKPILGTGFGVKYDQPIPLVRIPFPLQDYIPHNEIIWVLVKLGATGFFAFWYFFNCFVAKGTQIFVRLKDPYLKVITLVIVLAVINQMVVSFFDLQLTYYRNMLYLGCLMGLLPVIDRLKSENGTVSE